MLVTYGQFSVPGMYSRNSVGIHGGFDGDIDSKYAD
jgi:hypothetical protein